MAARARLAATRAPSRGVSRRFRDRARRDRAVIGFRPTRSAFRRPAGVLVPDVRTAEAARDPSCAFAPLQRATTATPHHPSPKAPTMLPLLSFDALRHVPRRRSRDGNGPTRRPSHVRGLVTSFAAITTVPAGASRAPERPWASPFKAVLARGSAPLEAWALLTLAVARRRRAAGTTVASRASCTRRVHPDRARGPTRGSLPGIHPSRAFPPSVRAFACSHDANPRTLRRDDVPTRLGLRASRIGRVGLSVSGLPALLGFRTFRPSQRSVHRAGERAHGFTSRARSTSDPDAL